MRHHTCFAVGGAGVILAVVTGCGPSTPSGAAAPATTAGSTSSTAAGQATPQAAGKAGSAAALLATLTVKGAGAKTGYDREGFPHWADLDHDGCDTRDEVLRAQMTNPSPADGCEIASGTLVDPYSGRRIEWVKNGPQLVDIDHVVALGDAWVSGAANDRAWDTDKRRALANDPLNVLAVDGRLNRQKGDSNAAAWVPPLASTRCDYAARQVAVKAKYALSVTPAERDALNRYLTPGCAVPTSDAPTTAASSEAEPEPAPTAEPERQTEPERSPEPEPEPERRTDPKAEPESTGGVSYPNCAAARAAGAAPLHRGDPGYSPRLDRDGNGVACE